MRVSQLIMMAIHPGVSTSQENRRKITPFHRILSPTRATTLLSAEKRKETTHFKTQAKQGKGTADHLMPLGDWFAWCCGEVELSWGLNEAGSEVYI